MKYFLDKNITLKRLRAIDGFRDVYSATGTAVGYPASIQEPNPDKVQYYEGQIGQPYFCYVEENCPVIDSDKAVHNGSEYMIKDVKVMDFGGQHYKRIIIVKDANQS